MSMPELESSSAYSHLPSLLSSYPLMPRFLPFLKTQDLVWPGEMASSEPHTATEEETITALLSC